MIQALAWIAIAFLATSHWLQVWKIHKHKEVRDISIWTYAFLLIGYLFLGTKASVDWYAGEGDLLWIVRQVATIIPVTIVILQIRTHSKDHWHDEEDSYCQACNSELEPHWTFCPYCGR